LETFLIFYPGLGLKKTKLAQQKQPTHEQNCKNIQKKTNLSTKPTNDIPHLSDRERARAQAGKFCELVLRQRVSIKRVKTAGRRRSSEAGRAAVHLVTGVTRAPSRSPARGTDTGWPGARAPQPGPRAAGTGRAATRSAGPSVALIFHHSDHDADNTARLLDSSATAAAAAINLASAGHQQNRRPPTH